MTGVRDWKPEILPRSEELPEPSKDPEVKEGVRQRRGQPGPQPGPRLTEEERRRLAGFFILLDEMDRAHARSERKAA